MPERIVDSGDVKIWSEDFGSPEDPTLLLIMGANASAMGWPDELVELLAEQWLHVIRYDHRDTGRSTHRDITSHPYSLSDLAADAVAVLDGWGVERAHVVGMSMGGTIGQLLALDYRHRLRSLTLMLTAALDVDFVGNIQRALNHEPAADGLPTPDPRVLAVLADRARPVADLEAELERRVAEWRALCGSELSFNADEFRRWETRAIEHAGTHVQPTAHAFAVTVPLTRGTELRGVATPTLVIQGRCDPLNPPPHGRHLADMIPNARLVEIAGMGHTLPSCIHRELTRLIGEHVRSATA